MRIDHLLVPIVVLTAAACRSPVTNGDVQADEASVRAVLASNEAATNRRDAAAVAATFTDDADMLLPGKPRIAGRDAIRRNEEAFYQTGFKEWRLTVQRVRFVTNDAALVDTSSTTVMEAETVRSRGVLLMVRRDGNWRITGVRAGLRD